MEKQTTPNYLDQDNRNNKSSKSSGRSMGGLILVAIGVVIMADRMDLGLPYWVTTWPMIPIAIGLYIGARQSFRVGGWLIPILVGVIALLQEEILDRDIRHLIFPTVIIAIGLYMIFRPKKTKWGKNHITEDINDGDFLDSSILFGGAKKNIISKNFTGGRIENFFGGTDLNMMQADFKGTIVMDFNVAFGGVKILVPPQWNVKNEITAVLGGIDDKRPSVQDADPTKLLILRGSVMFGGVDIKSY
ncbi:MAG: hypothetical protein HOP08_11705 [Cyclobacteriaceae bacterium]|nr:hypothetical protein [Cyclobacteriaceae bacterium]